jgi:hypothetical protein
VRRDSRALEKRRGRSDRLQRLLDRPVGKFEDKIPRGPAAGTSMIVDCTGCRGKHAANAFRRRSRRITGRASPSPAAEIHPLDPLVKRNAMLRVHNVVAGLSRRRPTRSGRVRKLATTLWQSRYIERAKSGASPQGF